MTTQLPPMRVGYRYICCSRCGERWNIAKTANTRHGYLCPECNRKKDKQYAVDNNLDYSAYMFYGTWHGVNRRRKEGGGGKCNTAKRRQR
ncbi:hypothetical protein [Anaerotignum sp. MB30-C6]|uniref:hypothetical protein n=1 Tax=Anaerotignum sp. MB30-C6 TaxID=3070814 RepID=UPI0027DB8CF3|nr:hypothetical protein [Anaerotignum sp. MB30-C6]WMI80944.1 hypothetical protein RBQ60_14155 [Anaerotignum sp. MB30-C6]